MAAIMLIKVMGSLSNSAPLVYTIDFVGPSAVKIAGPAQVPPAQKNAPAIQSPTKEQELAFPRKRQKHFVLPKPSLLSSYDNQSRAAPERTMKSRPTEAHSAPSASANVSADLPNFPYPWYISELRAQLWSQWSKRLPNASGKSVVVFSIMPNGQIVDLRTESSSGDAGFDIAALGAVQDASPFPPLPQGFTQPFLKIHLTLQSQ